MKNKFPTLLFLSAFFVRLVPAVMVYGTADVHTWNNFADLMMQGKWCLYSFTDHAVYPPLFYWIVYFTRLLSISSNLPFYVLIKLLPILADCFISLLIYRAFLFSGAGEKAAKAGGLFYALHPVSILITSIHGQFDSLVILFCLLAWFLFESRKNNFLSAICLGVGILLKGYPIILLPLFLLKIAVKKERLTYAILSILPTALSFIPYLMVDSAAVFNVAVKYSPRPGNWGYTLLLAVIHNHFPAAVEFLQRLSGLYGKFLLLFGLLWFYASAKKFNLFDSLTMIFALFYTLTAGFGLQYLIWIVPFAILSKNFPVKYYTVFASVWLLISYAELFPYGFYGRLITVVNEQILWQAAVACSLLTWLICGVWLFRELVLKKVAQNKV